MEVLVAREAVLKSDLRFILPKRPTLFDSFGLCLDIYTSRQADSAYKATRKSYNCFLFEHARRWRVVQKGGSQKG